MLIGTQQKKVTLYIETDFYILLNKMDKSSVLLRLQEQRQKKIMDMEVVVWEMA